MKKHDAKAAIIVAALSFAACSGSDPEASCTSAGPIPGEPVILVENARSVYQPAWTSTAIDARHIYFSYSIDEPHSNTISRVAKDGCTVEQVVDLSHPEVPETRNLAVGSDGRLYIESWDSGQFSKGFIDFRRAPVDGGPAERFATWPKAHPLAWTLGPSDLFALMADHKDYWIDRVPITGGSPTTLRSGPLEEIGVLRPDAGPRYFLAISGDRLLWIGPSGLESMPVSGGVVTTIAALPDDVILTCCAPYPRGAESIAVDGENAYIATATEAAEDTYTTRVWKQPLSGAPATVMYENESAGFGITNGPGLRLAGSDLCFADEMAPADGQWGRVKLICLSKTGGPVAVLQDVVFDVFAQRNPFESLAIDEGAAYWLGYTLVGAERCDHCLVKLAR